MSSSLKKTWAGTRYYNKRRVSRITSFYVFVNFIISFIRQSFVLLWMNDELDQIMIEVNFKTVSADKAQYCGHKSIQY